MQLLRRKERVLESRLVRLLCSCVTLVGRGMGMVLMAYWLLVLRLMTEMDPTRPCLETEQCSKEFEHCITGNAGWIACGLRRRLSVMQRMFLKMLVGIEGMFFIETLCLSLDRLFRSLLGALSFPIMNVRFMIIVCADGLRRRCLLRLVWIWCTVLLTIVVRSWLRSGFFGGVRLWCVLLGDRQGSGQNMMGLRLLMNLTV